MRFQPVNPNPSLSARHTLYLATTGGGKSQAVLQNPAIPWRQKTARIVMWDQAGDYPGLHCDTRAGFIRHLRAGIAGGGGFRVAFSGPATVENFEWWCEVVWSILDGNHDTHIIAEELSGVCPSAGKATPNAAILLNQSRKFGGIFHGISQKPQEVAKTYYDQAALKYVGQQKGAAMRRKMAGEIGVTPDQVAALEPLQFFKDDGSAKEPDIVTLKYKKPTGVKWAA